MVIFLTLVVTLHGPGARRVTDLVTGYTTPCVEVHAGNPLTWAVELERNFAERVEPKLIPILRVAAGVVLWVLSQCEIRPVLVWILRR